MKKKLAIASLIVAFFCSFALNIVLLLPYHSVITNKFKKYTSVADSVMFCNLVRNKSIMLAKEPHKIIVGYKGLLDDIRSFYFSPLKGITNNYNRGLLFTGLALYAEAYCDTEIRGICSEHLKSFIDSDGNFKYEVKYCDQALIGVAYCSMYRQTKESIYKKAAYNLFLFLKEKDNYDTGIMYREFADWQYCDVLGMTIPFLMEYSNTFNDSIALSIAYRNFDIYYTYGVDKETGIPCHGYNIKNHMKLGSMNWGRGIGWYLLAASYLPEFSDLLLDKNIQYLDYEQFLWVPGGSFFDASTALLFELYKTSKGLSTRGIMFMQPHTLVDGSISDVSGDTYFLNKYSSIRGESEIGNALFMMLLAKRKNYENRNSNFATTY